MNGGALHNGRSQRIGSLQERSENGRHLPPVFTCDTEVRQRQPVFYTAFFALWPRSRVTPNRQRKETPLRRPAGFAVDAVAFPPLLFIRVSRHPVSTNLRLSGAGQTIA